MAVVPYPLEAMVALVMDIPSYRDFLPWCAGARILKEEEVLPPSRSLEAELAIRYKIFQERYVSRVTLSYPSEREAVIEAVHIRGPLRALSSRWLLSADPSNGGSTKVDFSLHYELGLGWLDQWLGKLFDRAALRMIEAFESRAATLYRSKAQDLIVQNSTSDRIDGD